MVQEILKTQAYVRLQKLIRDRFGKVITLRFIEDVSLFNLENKDPFLKNGNLHVPILSKNEYLATAVLHDINSQFSEKENVSDMIRMVIEPTLKKWKLLQRAQNDQTNLDQFPFQILKNEFEHTPPSEFGRSQALASQLFLLQSKNPYSILRIAVQIHHIVQSWSFLNYREMKYPFLSVQDYKELGPVTLFIEDILIMSPDEKRVLNELYLDHDSATDPLVLVGSTSDLRTLSAEIVSPTSLFRKLDDNKIQIDLLPLNLSLLKETLELILDPYPQLV